MGELISNEKPDGNKYPVQKTDQEWKSELSDFEYHVLRQAGQNLLGVVKSKRVKT